MPTICRLMIAALPPLCFTGTFQAAAAASSSTVTLHNAEEFFVDVFPGCSDALYDIHLTNVNGVEHITHQG